MRNDQGEEMLEWEGFGREVYAMRRKPKKMTVMMAIGAAATLVVLAAVIACWVGIWSFRLGAG
jgi:hypothetical protein